jgi:8-oxo-dGTP pyrophosphatase MutT (NUDIX family)/predicted GNAT family acetyltransferase
MNIHELDSYNLGDAVKFHRRLNPRIWGRDEHLLSEVREKLLAIAADFQEFLGVEDLNVQDITISGSNAAYSYTKNSDIDLHLVVEMPDNPVYQELFSAKKYQYNDEHNIRIGGADVELYVQPADQAHHSLGIYSVKNEDWISVPQRKRAQIDDACVRDKVSDLDARIHSAIQSKDLGRISTLWDKIKVMRQSGLEQHGEFGCENIAFKLLRNKGCIAALKDAKTALQDLELSLREANKPRPRFRYGFGEDMEDPTQQPYSSADGVAPTTKSFLESNNSNDSIVQDFIQQVTMKLGIDPMPEIHLHTDPDWSENNHSFGRYDPDSHTLNVSMPNRHIMDVLRTVAHELVHCSQNQQHGSLPDDAGETGSRWENDANARAGIIMRDWANSHPEHFAHDSLEESQIDHKLAADAITTALSTSVQEQQQPSHDPQAQQPNKVLQTLGTAMKLYGLSKLTVPGAKEEFTQEFKNYIRAQGGDPNAQNLSRIYQMQQQPQTQPQNESASGYIPKNKKEAQKPQYAMALSVDIKPGQVGKEANKLALNTGRNGEPSLLMKTVNLREYRMPQPSQGPGRYRDLNEPLGPETPPRMPSGTIKVDVSDTQDWYQLGQDISNLSIANKDHYNQGPPHTVLAFGSEDLEHMYIQQLKRLGLNTHDLDEPGEEDIDEAAEGQSHPIKFADGYLTFTDHFVDRLDDHDISKNEVMRMLQKLERTRSIDLIRMPFVAFVVKSHNLGLAIYKTTDKHNDTVYVVATAHRTLNSGEDQDVIYLEEDDTQDAAGIVLYAEDTGRYGLQQRSETVGDPGVWAAWGGGREPGESLEQCARRELAEEGGYTGPIHLEHLGENSRYVTFLGHVPHEFEPRADDEWQDYCWVEAGDWPGPMHPGTAAALANIPVNENFLDEADASAVQFQTASIDNYQSSFTVTAIADGKTVGHFSFFRDPETDDVHNQAEVTDDVQGKGYGKALLLKAIEVANDHGLGFQEDSQSLSRAQSRVYDSLYDAGWIVDADGYWFLTPEGEQELARLSTIQQGVAEARKNPEQNTKYQSGWAELAAWARKNNVWLKPHEWAISMTYVPKLGINPGPGISEDTPRGIYFYPFQWAYSVKMDKEALPWADNAPYIQLFQYSTGTELYDPNQIPLASAVAQLKNYGITDEDIAAEKENYPSISTYNLLVWCLGRKYDDNKRVSILNKVLRNLGYDYMIDNGKGWIAINEPTQGVVLNPKIIDKVVTFNNYTRKKEQDIEENFADGKNPGRKGLSKRVGVNTKASVSDLRKTAKNSSGEKQRMAHWLANMKAGRAKAKRK